MTDFKIISDSSCDIPDSLLNENDISLVPFYVSFDKENYFKERVEISLKDFYYKLEKEKIFPKTSLPSMQDYLTLFTSYAKEGQDILCFCLSSVFSGSYQSAQNAKNILSEEYPDIKIEVVDSRQATAGQGLIVLEAVRMRDDGLSLEETLSKIEVLKNDVRIQFTVDTLEYLQMGGRIGKASALAGSILNVKPLIVMKEGELIPSGVIRGRKKALQKIVDMTVSDLEGRSYGDYRFVLAHVHSANEINKLEKKLNEEYGIYIDYPEFTIGTTIGTNTGSSAIGICYIPKYETYKN
ncbi:DegV family protein [Vallitalea okinawensis]|uniref:DegV family protein n=1 Tax=Vallitalea okinawensis TaxID=2078660 RepID=UPI001300BD77|nr:DegV family protein [Vallitalea okinawensis]